MVNIVVLIEGFQHGGGPFYVRRATFYCKDTDVETNALFKVPPPTNRQEAMTFHFQARLHGLDWIVNDDEQHEQDEIHEIWTEFLQKVKGRCPDKPIYVFCKGREIARWLEEKLNCAISNIEDYGNIGNVKTMAYREKLFYIVGITEGLTR